METNGACMTAARFGVCVAAAVAALAVPGMARAQAGASASAPAAPAHQVIACYFHRTVRCPTCQKIGAGIDEAVKAGFAQQLADGTVRLADVDFQDAKNQHLTKAYQVDGPTLVIIDVRDGKVTRCKKAPRVWSLLGNPAEFAKYLQDEINDYLAAGAAAGG